MGVERMDGGHGAFRPLPLAFWGKESDKERNELLREHDELQREKNSYLLRIAKHLENSLGPEEFEVPVADSTMRE